MKRKQGESQRKDDAQIEGVGGGQNKWTKSASTSDIPMGCAFKAAQARIPPPRQ